VSDVRLIMIGSVIIVVGFFIGGMAGSEYNQFAIQETAFGDCYDYSTGTAVHVNCGQKQFDNLLELILSIALIGGGVTILIKGMRGKWDQNVKSDEMVGPKRD
jgi:hypothetical protein